MDVHRAISQRRMVRSFDGSALEPEEVLTIFDDALRAPTAGNARGISWLVLVGALEVSRYFEAATDPAWRAGSARYEGLKGASAIGLCIVDVAAYVARYGEQDKVSSGLGQGPDAWPVPYWFGDAGASCMAALLRIEEEGLNACFLGAFRGAEALHQAFSIPSEEVIYGAILLGRGDGGDHRAASLDRAGPSRAARLHRGSFER
jgi:nitroreductase